MRRAKRAAAGCWTCRVRRKKCDNVQPHCGVCKSLEIPCHSTFRAPEWMSNPSKKREMLDKIKYQIKKNSISRREKGQARARMTRDGEVDGCQFVIEFEDDSSRGLSCSIGNETNAMIEDRSTSSAEGWKQAKAQVPAPPIAPQTTSVSKAIGLSGFVGQPGLVLEFFSCDKSSSSMFSQDSDYETDMIMKYLDYVFPFLFPFYQPAIFEGGRGWLLSLLRHSSVAFHSILSLTSYFFTIAIRDAYGDAYRDCTVDLWTRLEQQIDKCFEMVQANMLDLTVQGKTAAVRQKVHNMESIVQILMFEIVVGRAADWRLHLTPALALFEEVFNRADGMDSKMVSALRSIGVPSWYKAEFNTYIWNPDQAGYRFFAALLVFIDIIASSALQQQPRLSAYHPDLLDAQDDGAPILGFTHIRLSTVIGCQNSVLLIIGQIASLDAWKQSIGPPQRLSTPELAERAAPIHTALKLTIEELVSKAASERPVHAQNRCFQPYAVRSSAPAPSNTTTRIWAHAARIYLTVVVCGWRSSNAEIREHVSSILELVDTIPSNHFRTLVWPLCVAGCLASTGQEQDFRSIFAGKSELEMIGSMNEARRVMEKVWENRSSLDAEMWDLASCFSIQGKPVLLI